MKTCNLILIPESSNCDIRDFNLIAEKIRQTARDIRVHVVKRRHLWWRQWAFLFSSSLYVAFYEAKKFRPVRGTCLHGSAMHKSEQYRQMQLAGMEVIQWQTIASGERYTTEIWGCPVIVKPDWGREGQGVHLSIPEDINFNETCLNGEAHLIQKFVKTGDSPTYFRALTLFGEILYLRKTTNMDSQLASGSVVALPNPVANADHGRSELVNDAEVIAFAKQVARSAFPKIPLLGQDIIRDVQTGRLYCLEVNPYGSTWHFSTSAGRKLQQREKLDYQNQFGAFTLAASTLIDKTREMAC